MNVSSDTEPNSLKGFMYLSKPYLILSSSPGLRRICLLSQALPFSDSAPAFGEGSLVAWGTVWHKERYSQVGHWLASGEGCQI